MPQRTVYIRAADLELWSTTPNKAELVSNALNSQNPIHKSNPKAKHSLVWREQTIPSPTTPDPIVGYSCCTLSKPCKHWVWDGISLAYINTITGEAREAA